METLLDKNLGVKNMTIVCGMVARVLLTFVNLMKFFHVQRAANKNNLVLTKMGNKSQVLTLKVKQFMAIA